MAAAATIELDTVDLAASVAGLREPMREIPDTDSGAWLRSLSAAGAERDAALARLHALLLGGARFEVRRRGVHGEEAEDLAQQAAADALVAVLAKLDRYRGESRFTTWAYKFALLEAAVRVRRRAWREREIPTEEEAWRAFADPRARPAEDAETRELLRAIEAAIRERLTPHQRDVLVALALNEVPIDVLAERLQTTRGALYKTLHARRKLRAHLDLQRRDR